MHQETYFFHRHLLKERTALNKCSQQVGKLERSFYVKMHVSGENRLQRYEKIEFLGEGQVTISFHFSHFLFVTYILPCSLRQYIKRKIL